MDIQKSSTYRLYERSARRGLIFGPYLSLIFFATSYSIVQPSLSLAALVLMAAVPFMIFSWLRHSFVAEKGMLPFSALWMEGIAMFIFGALAASLITGVFMTMIKPDFIHSQAEALVEFYRTCGWERGQEAADMIETAITRRLLPTAMDSVIDMFWLIVFSGSMLSMILAFLVPLKRLKSSN